MLRKTDRARLCVVLVGARNPQNIGAAARAMRDFGFSDLRFVNDFAAPFEAAQLEAIKSAVASADIMSAARRFPTVAEAVADCTLVIGTTAIGERTLTQRVLPLAEAAPVVRTALQEVPTSRAAILFGSEKTGLTNDQLSHCQLLTTIPMFDPSELGSLDRRHLSMNLGQSVAVCLYELVREGMEGAKPLPQDTAEPATGEDRERLTQLLLATMQQSGYARRFPANARENTVRHLAQRLAADRLQAQTWMGLLKMLARSTSASEDE